METPDVTKAQLIALAQAILATLVAFGINLSFKQQAVLMADSAVVAGLLVAGDVALRRGRQKHLGGAVRLADVAEAIAKTRTVTGGIVPVERLRTAVEDTAATHDAAVEANGPQPPPGTYAADAPPPPEAQPQQPAF